MTAIELIAQILYPCVKKLSSHTLVLMKSAKKIYKLEMLYLALGLMLASLQAGLILQSHITQVWKKSTAQQEQLKEPSKIT